MRARELLARQAGELRRRIGYYTTRTAFASQLAEVIPAELAEALELAWRSTMRGGRWLGVFDGRSA